MSVGTIISGKYQIDEEIKRGGFGIIYKGRDTNFDKPVAIKAVEPGLLNQAKFIDMFQQEALSIARLNHQNIIQIYDIKHDESGQIYIIMEFIDGVDLLTLLKACKGENKQLPYYITAHIISEVCNGLDYAHNRINPETQEHLQLVHKDISPQNIMLTNTGEIKIIDFGMATFSQSNNEDDNSIHIQGNVRYMAPEQFTNTESISRKTDVFSMGVVLFEILTGERLIPSKDRAEIVERLMHGNYDLNRLDSEQVPEKLRQICKKAIQHNPSNRYENATQMYRDLMHFLILTMPTANGSGDLANFMLEVNSESYKNTNGEHSNSNGASSSNSGTFNDSTSEATMNGIPENEEKPNDEPVVEEPISTNGQDSDKLNTEEEQSQNNDSFSEESDEESIPEKPEDGTIENENPQVAQETDEQQANNFYSFVEDDEENNQKTIIDVVRLSARTHKKAITLTLLSLLIGLIGFVTADTFLSITPLGTYIFDTLFPPAIKITSVPAGAQVYLDNVLLDKTTPLNLEEISPGVHKLVLTMPQYESIVKSINVPSKGALAMAGETKRQAGRPYVLKFKNQFDITSNPEGADIIIEGVKLNQKSPATIFWDVSDQPTDIKLELSGYSSLSGLSISSINNKEFIQDNRIWSLKKPTEGKAHYAINGAFHKNIVIISNPKFADIYHNGSEKPVSISGINGSMMLKIGEHSFTLRKKGYLPTSFNLTINDNTTSRINKDLLRNVKIFAKDDYSKNDRDINAQLISISRKSKTTKYRKKTPVVLQLPPYTYSAKLQKPGYHDLEISINPGETSVVANMQPLYYDVTIETIDAITSSPVDSVRILYKAENVREPQKTIGLTNASGKLNDRILPGTYEFSIYIKGYQQQTKVLQLVPNSNNRLTFRLTALR